MTANKPVSIDPLESAQRSLTRRGYQVVIEGSKLRFVGGDSDVIQDIQETIESQDDEATRLSNLLTEMGFDVDVEGKYLVARPVV